MAPRGMATAPRMRGVLLGLALAACAPENEEGGPRHCEGFGPVLQECNAGDAASWGELCQLVVLTEECLTAMRAADCADHRAGTPSYADVCFPPCHPPTTESVCNGDDTLTVCNESTSRLQVVRCARACAVRTPAETYTGVCDDVYNDVPSASGRDICWCEP